MAFQLEEISDNLLDGFRLLLTQSDNSFKKLLNSLSKAELLYGHKKLAKLVVSKTQPELTKNVETLLRTIGTLYELHNRSRAPYQEIFDAIYKILKRKGLDLTKSSKEIFNSRINALLKNKQLYIASKSLQLSYENEDIYVSARMHSDIRPVFDENLSDLPKAGMIVNILHLHYQHGEESDHRDIYMALDEDDIKSLKEILDRAIEKNNLLKTIIKNSGMIYLDQTEKE